MTRDGKAEALPGADRPITRADLEAKFEQLKGSAEAGVESSRSAGIALAAGTLVLLVLVAYLLGRRRGRKRQTIIEIKRV